jgi:hypothetical protein
MAIDKAEDTKRSWPGDFVARGRDPMEWTYQAEVLKKVALAVFEQAKNDRKLGVIRLLWVDSV